jgi:hypothetical protein
MPLWCQDGTLVTAVDQNEPESCDPIGPQQKEKSAEQPVNPSFIDIGIWSIGG